MSIINPGTIQTLPVFEKNAAGLILGTLSEKVFLPKADIRDRRDEPTEIEVFTFYNENRDLEATTLLPTIQAGEIGVAKVISVTDIGAFVSIGSKRDILIPAREQKEPLEAGKKVLIALAVDPNAKRLVCTTRLSTVLETNDIPFERGDEVEVMIGERIEIGRRVVVEGKYVGILFRQEMMREVQTGELVKCYVRKIEGKDITVSMQKEGVALLDEAKKMLFNYLEMNGGYVRLNDDTDPEEIKLRLHMSKKTFKKAAGMLYSEGKILLTKFGIKLNTTGEKPLDWEERSKQWAKDKEEDVRHKPNRSLPTRNGTENDNRRAPREFKPRTDFNDPPPRKLFESGNVDKKGSFARSSAEKAAEKEEKRKEMKAPANNTFQRHSKTSKFSQQKPRGKKK